MLLGPMRIPVEKAEIALALLVEGNGIRTTERITGLNRNTLCDLVLLIGRRCERFLQERVTGAKVEDVQIDEIWGFVGCKQRLANRKVARDESDGENIGDAYAYIAIESTSKLVLAFAVGKRADGTTRQALNRLDMAVPGRFQLTSDGYAGYTKFVPRCIGKRIDYAQLVKIYGHNKRSGKEPTQDSRYSPAVITAIRTHVKWGAPDPAKINTSYIERFNLDVRMKCRRMTRLTNGFSKSWAHHEAAIALLLCWHNFCRVHGTTKTTPAVAAGIAEKPWSIRTLLAAIAG